MVEEPCEQASGQMGRGVRTEAKARMLKGSC